MSMKRPEYYEYTGGTLQRIQNKHAPRG